VYDGADSAKATPIGEVARVFPGCCQSAFTEADNFTLAFPPAADPLKRSSLVAAVLLLNYIAFENKKKNNHDH
jgi:hypothetical protein